MRDDMSKVVTERPRQGHGNKSKKTTGQRIRRYDPHREYDEPTRLPIARHRQYGYDAKEFSDLINPLKRYLRTCIGKPWRKVHSDASMYDRADSSGPADAARAEARALDRRVWTPPAYSTLSASIGSPRAMWRTGR